MDLRKIEESFFHVLMIVSTLIIVLSLVLIMGTVIFKGLPALNLAMITQTPKGGYYLGKEGGILNAIVGSLYLAGGATVLAIIISLPIVLYLNIYANQNSRLVGLCRFSLDVLWGIPSIVYGAFGFSIMLFFGLRASLLGGIIAVSLMVLPIMCRAMDEVVRLVPTEIIEASYSLGSTKLETSFKVVVRQALPGILTAVLISFGRGIGDAASVLFTAGFSDDIPFSLFRPAATLPLAIFFQLGTPFPEVRERAYASALILTVLILIISILSRMLTKRFTANVVK
ncbi:MAG TPA: phosphate ABC transporter permease PstA [Thermodesulfobacteriota bacterium]|nr:phosphate ABC transporter permease PstA [Deltaproteobacteria bacterium]HNR12817.1 phosphate ABC transporter permease PstA [Thermodesulfobacteriota bacterium]HOC38688.1 phosphate ABC transporter permease PstA [Thermodesulfobacteriota bacterium]HQO76972.1 phosphate ABC transporter permease PstA [Thermodesulfobacteriota bacterium]